MKSKNLRQTIATIISVAILGISITGCGRSTGDTNASSESVSTGSTNASEESVSTGSTSASEGSSASDKVSGDISSQTEEDTSKTSGDTSSLDSDSTDSNNESDAEPDIYSARYVISDMGFGMSIGNALDAFVNSDSNKGVLRNDGLDTETSWSNPKITQEYIDAIKAQGISVIRIPVTWYNHTDPDTYEIDSAWLARVEEVINYALDEDTYVILNLHHDTGTDGWLHASEKDLEWKKEVLKSFWEQIATYYKDYDGHLLFESFNEILDDNNEWNNPAATSVSITNDLNQLFVDTVRSTGGNNAERVLIVNSYCGGCNVKMLKNFSVPTDSKEDGLIAEVHAYTPYFFTAPDYPDYKTWKKSDIDSMLKFVNDTFTRLNTPVIIGEFGACPKDNENALREWASYYVSSAAEYGIKCFWWDNGYENEYGLFDRNTGEPFNRELLDALLNAAPQAN